MCRQSDHLSSPLDNLFHYLYNKHITTPNGCSFITMGFVHYGDNKVEAQKGLEAFDIED